MFGLCLFILGLAGLSPVPFIAELIGTTEPAIKLLLSLFTGYPLAIFYDKYVKQYDMKHRNYYFILMGLDIAFYNFGRAMYHNLIPAIVIYLTTLHLGTGKMHVIVTFIFNSAYLTIGYVMTASDDYDITWTMPQCVLTLKLIALSFDLWDGEKKKKGEQLSENNKITALESPPTFEELMGFVYFPACFLVGPMFSFRRYKDFISDKFPLDKFTMIYEHQALKRFIQGVLYLIAYQVGVTVFSMKYILSDDFLEISIFYRHLYCGLWAHFALYKYISCWLLTEAACIRFGFSYNGTQQIGDKSVSKWDGCNNIKLLRFEGATKFQHYVDSFNCNTNHFAAEYVYKRLKFLGNRNLSQFATLLFLALWHGTQSGYYMTFTNEFFIILMEKEFESFLIKTDIYHEMWSNNITKYYLYIVLKTYTIVFMGWSLAPFDVKSFSKWWKIYSRLYFTGFILFLPWPFIYKKYVKKGLEALDEFNKKNR